MGRCVGSVPIPMQVCTCTTHPPTRVCTYTVVVLARKQLIRLVTTNQCRDATISTDFSSRYAYMVYLLSTNIIDTYMHFPWLARVVNADMEKSIRKIFLCRWVPPDRLYSILCTLASFFYFVSGVHKYLIQIPT